ncbi:MAG: lysophospholipid acyltransferase family protein [Opitutaceae bacterium]
MRLYTQAEMTRVYGLFHYISVVVYDMFFRGEVIGIEHLPKTGAFLIASNHASHLDSPIIGSQVRRQVCFFGRKNLWKPGIAAWWLDAVGTIPVDRDGGQALSAIKRVLRALANDKVLILFPEGTRSPDGGLQTPKPGVGMIVCSTQVPVVPARIFGSFEAFGKGIGFPRAGNPVSVVFGPPLSPSQYDPGAGKDRYQQASERIFEVISKLKRPEITVV